MKKRFVLALLLAMVWTVLVFGDSFLGELIDSPQSFTWEEEGQTESSQLAGDT